MAHAVEAFLNLLERLEALETLEPLGPLGTLESLESLESLEPLERQDVLVLKETWPRKLGEGRWASQRNEHTRNQGKGTSENAGGRARRTNTQGTNAEEPR